MEHFEFDPDKSKSNLKRHGIDFLHAQDLWDETHVIIPAKNVAGESRCVILGKLAEKLYAAIFTRRNEAIRLISCHRADERWERIYGKYIEKKENQ